MRRPRLTTRSLLVRALALAGLCTCGLHASTFQTTGVLRITVSLVNAEQQATPVPRHVLLVSDNPASTVPRRVVTAADGTASLKLPPGNYTVESDKPVAFLGRQYQWTQTLDVAVGRDTTLALTAANADVGAVTGASDAPAARPVDPSDVLTLWQPSVVSLWTPTRRASGFVIDARGLVVTSQQVVGTAATLEVQLSPAVKRLGQVLAADAANDVAVLRVDQQALAALTPVPIGCGAPATPLVEGQEIVAIDAGSGRRLGLAAGKLRRVSSRTMIADFSLDEASVGGPAFTAAGQVVGLTSLVGAKEGDARDTSRVVRLDAVCDVVASAEKKLSTAAPPSASALPVEPAQSIPTDVLEDLAKRRAGSLSPLTATSAGFDLAFLTPLQVYAGLSSMDFANWSDYVSDTPSVLLVRVTPKMAEKPWTRVARGVAMTRGIMLPPIKSFKSGFARLKAFCADAEVTPIHPLLLERRVSETDAIYEGLYVFDPDALAPRCGTVRLEVYADKEPGKPDPAVIDPKVVEQIWQDFAPYRALPRP